MWLSVTWNVKGSINCSVLFCNVTLVLTLSVTLDSLCIMSVAERRILFTENISDLLVCNNIRPVNSWHVIMMQLDPVFTLMTKIGRWKLCFLFLCCKNVITNNIQHKENMKTKDSIVVSTDGLLIGCVHNNF